jgi:hypothetical protein
LIAWLRNSIVVAWKLGITFALSLRGVNMHTERLLKLADFLETVPPDKFDMNGWGREDDCGFAGCAIGWAGKLFDGKGLETFPLKDCREGNYNIGVRITDDKDIVS